MEAWLQLKPEGARATNEDLYGGAPPEVSEDVAHLPAWLLELGAIASGGLSVAPLTFCEIEAWSRLTDNALTPFEARALASMSRVYAHIASKPNAPCPIESTEIKEAKDAAGVSSWLALAKRAPSAAAAENDGGDTEGSAPA